MFVKNFSIVAITQLYFPLNVNFPINFIKISNFLFYLFKN